MVFSPKTEPIHAVNTPNRWYGWKKNIYTRGHDDISKIKIEENKPIITLFSALFHFVTNILEYKSIVARFVKLQKEK